MGQTKIQWTATLDPSSGELIPGYTFNPWWGCFKVSPGCKFCYAERDSNRFSGGVNMWGKDAPRKLQSDGYWSKPLQWDKRAEKTGIRLKVFCASMADIFEDYHPRFAEVVPDGYTLDIEKQRERLWQLILDTPNLEWLLLTKRPENFKWRPFGDKWPDNVWLGVSAENQNYADERIPLLLAEDAKVRFVSFEPLVGGIDALLYMMPQFAADDPRHHPWRNGLEWNITGGESGAQARPADPNWFRRLRDDSVSMDIPFHFKQWGEFDATEERVGKHEAGRLLDGREWNQYPGYMR